MSADLLTQKTSLRRSDTYPNARIGDATDTESSWSASSSVEDTVLYSESLLSPESVGVPVEPQLADSRAC